MDRKASIDLKLGKKQRKCSNTDLSRWKLLKVGKETSKDLKMTKNSPGSAPKRLEVAVIGRKLYKKPLAILNWQKATMQVI